MKLILSFAASAAVASLAGCSQANQDDTAANVDTAGSGESVLPVEDNAAGSDTLGNQLNQLNESGNATESGNSAGAGAENSANSY